MVDPGPKNLIHIFSFFFFTVETCTERVSSSSGNGGLLLGAYKPQCNEQGDYKKKQCHGSTGYCWCVDSKTGREIKGTKKHSREGDFKCGKRDYQF